MTTKDLNARQARWAEELASYDFRIEHIKGKGNKVADALSRRADYREGEKDSVHEPMLIEEKGTLIINPKMKSKMITLEKDEILTAIKEETKKQKERTEIEINEEGLKEFNGMIFVPKATEQIVMKRYHDDIREGHPGIARTMEKIQRTYYFPGMYRKLKKYIANCDSCRRNKNDYQKPHGTMINEKEPSTEPWKKLTADFMEMPETTNHAGTEVYNELLVVVDTFSKATVLIPTKKTATSEEIFHLLWERVFAVYGIPDEILSDRDRIFKTEKWSNLMIRIGARQKLSTAYHQQTDGQSERKIQELRAYYRHYLDYEQQNWVELTPLTQYAMNDATNATTGETPNFIIFGTRRIHGRETRSSETDITHQETMRQVHKEVEMDMKWNKLITKKYYDLKRGRTPQFQGGERVYLRRRTSGEKPFNIKTGRRSQKLDSIKIGPYRIQERMDNDNYRLALPPRMRIHPVFHISLLSLTKNPETETEIEIEDEYEVERILDKRERNETTEYLVKWKDYPNEENTWEPTTHLQCPDRVQEYQDHLRSLKVTRSRRN
jgi:hypothetical protein